MFYVQAPCIVPRELYTERLVFGLFAGCLMIFIFLFTYSYFDTMKYIQRSLYVDYDVKTITAADYGIEFDITKEQYAHWKSHYH